jgi:hypothetical protein
MNLQAPQTSAPTVADLPPILGRTQEQIVENALDGDARAVERFSLGRRLGVIDLRNGRLERVLDAPSRMTLDEPIRACVGSRLPSEGRPPEVGALHT